MRVAKPSQPWGMGKHSDRVMPAAVSVLIHLGHTARALLRRLARAATAMGKRRDARRAAEHRAGLAAAAQADVATHVAFLSPKWHVPFFHAVDGGGNTWVLPPGARSRPATAQEQALLDALEAKEVPEAVEATDWVVRRYGVLPGPYMYSESLGTARALPPAPTGELLP